MTTFKQFLESNSVDIDGSAKKNLYKAKEIINGARADLGRELAGYSVRDLLLDNMPLKSVVVDKIISLLRAEGFLSNAHHGG